MAASVNLIPSVDFLLKAGGNAVGCGTGGTLTINQTLNESHSDCAANWNTRTVGPRSWSLALDALVSESGGSILTGHDNGDDPITVTIGGTALKGLTEVSLALALGVAEAVNSTTGLDRALDPTVRSLEVTIANDYYDPAGTGAGAYAAVLDAVTGETSAALEVVVTVGGVSLTFNAHPTTANVTKSNGEILKAGITLVSTGAVTNGTTGLATGIGALLTAFFTAGRAAALTVLAATATADNTEWTGSAYPTSINLTVPFSGDVTISATLEGTGPLTRDTTEGE